MAVNKVKYGNQTVIDLSTDTVSDASHIVQGYVGHLRDGTVVEGTAASGGVVITDTPDPHGGTIREITTSNVINLGTKSITENGTYTATSDNLTGYASVMVNVPSGQPSLQSKTKSYTPSTSTQSETVTADNGYDGLSSVQVSVSAIPSQYIVPSGTINISDNGTVDVSSYASANVQVAGSSGKNVQAYRGYATVTATSYTATAVTLTVAKTGTYNVSWMGYRNTNSGTSGSQLYVNGTARGSASTTFVNTYGQSVSLTNQSFNAGDVLVVRARARSTSYVMGVGNLIIEEV